MSSSRLMRSSSGARKVFEREDVTPTQQNRMLRGSSARRFADKDDLPGQRRDWSAMERANSISGSLPSDPEQARNRMSGAQRPSTSYHNRAAGGQYTRVPDAWQATRGSQFRISALEKAPVSCEKCVQQAKQIQAMKRKLSLLQDKHEASFGRLPSFSQDPETALQLQNMQKERDYFRNLAEDLQFKLDFKEGDGKKQKEIDRLLLLVDELRKKLKSHEEEMVKAEAKHEQALQDAVRRENEAHAKTRKLEAERLAEQSEKMYLRSRISELEAEIQELQKDGKANNSRASNAEKERTELLAKVKALEQERIELMEDIRRHVEDSTELAATMTELEVQLEKCRKELAEQVYANKELEEELTVCKGDFEAYKISTQKQQAQYETKMAALQKAYNNAKDDMRVLENELNDSKGKLDQLMQDFQRSRQEYTSKIEGLEENLKGTQDSCRKMQEDMELQRQENDSLSKKIQDLEEELAKANKELGKVVVVTPKITVTHPNGMKDMGKMDLPMHVLRDLVAKQLGYSPEELLQVGDVSEIHNLRSSGKV